MSVSELSIAKIDPSPLNPRKTFDQAALDELALDIRSRGVLQNVVVRSKRGGRYELIVGERRYRAAKIATLETIPASVTEMDDAQALETMIVENAKRADIDPIEEADAYRQLLETHRLTVDDICTKVGKSRSAVYARLKLCELGKSGRKAMADGAITPSVALLVARIPSDKMQRDAVKSVSGDKWHAGMSARRALEYIERHYMLRLGEAPWKTNDAELLPAAGACSSCPKRTGNQAELFADIKSADVCTDPPCFEKKRKAYGERRKAEAKAAGATVLKSTQAREIIEKPYYDGAEPRLQWNAPYVDTDAKCDDDPKRRTYRKLLKPAIEDLTIATAHGQVFELIPKKGLGARLKAAGHKFADKTKSASGGASSHNAYEKRQKTKRAYETEIDRRALGRIFELEKEWHDVRTSDESLKSDDIEWLRFLLERFASNLWGAANTLCTVLGIEAKSDRRPAALKEWFQHKDRTQAELSGLLVMVAATDYRQESMPSAATLYKLDLKVIEKQVREDAKRLGKSKKKKRAKPAKAKKKTPKKKASRKGSRNSTIKTSAKKAAKK